MAKVFKKQLVRMNFLRDDERNSKVYKKYFLKESKNLGEKLLDNLRWL